MKNRILTNSLRNIKRSFPRFLSLIVISMLGVFTFAGLSATSPDMVITLDNYLDSRNNYDIKITSTMGLVDNDINKLSKLNNIKEVEGNYSLDSLVKSDEDEYIINISSLPEKINKLELLSGRFPKEDNEIVVEEELLTSNNLKMGDYIYLKNDNLNNQNMKIVGTIDSSLYFNYNVNTHNRGTTSIGSGTINYYTYCLKENFKQDYYTNIYITIDKAKKEITSSNKYLDYIEQGTKIIKNLKSELEEDRYNEIYNKAKNEIDEEKENAEKEFNEIGNQLSNKKYELDKASLSLNNALSELENGKKNLDFYRNELDNSWNNYYNTLASYNLEDDTLLTKLEELDNTINYYQNMQVSQELVSNENDENNYQEVLNQLIIQKKAIEELINGKNELLASEEDYKSKVNELNNGYNSYYYNYGIFNENLRKYNIALNEFNNKKEEVYNKLNEAYLELNNIKHPVIYTYDREDYLTYSEYIDDTNSLKNLAKLFPGVFFAVAILVSLISMNRMIEDDRGELGTLKSLGFSNRKILFKYFIFAFTATIIGGVIGSILGLIIIPSLIFKIYKILFTIPNFYLSLNLKYTLLGIIISFICVCGTTVYTVMKELKEKPSQLMRPKAPKNGKRVFLENIKFIWNRLSFSNKVTIRNLFRYKKRVLVTLIGIAGCCGLILTGFGIKDSIMDLSKLQFGYVMKFDGYSYINDIDNVDEIFNNDKITSITKVNNLNAKINNTNAIMFITDYNENLEKIINLYSVKDKKRLKLDNNKIIVTEKLARLQNLKVGDKIEIIDVDNNSYNFEISGIAKNYFEHYIFLSRDVYEKAGGKFNLNAVYFNTKNITSKQRKELITSLLENDGVLAVNNVSTMIKSITNMLNSLDEVVFILIVLAALLAFVVLYNLSNINISERKREIATLKVLGFYNKEVDNYITKETIILTIIGIAIGLVFGYFLTGIIITSVEIEKARFVTKIWFKSYLYATFMSFIFTLIVNFITHFSLKKIDMIESLKSVE